MSDEVENKEEKKYPYRGRRGWLMIPLCGIGALLLFGLVVMLLWNNLLPGLFGFQRINYWTAIGILILAKILFGGGFRRGRFWGGSRCGYGGYHGYGGWKHRKEWKDKWLNMTEEERMKFKEEWKNRGKSCNY